MGLSLFFIRQRQKEIGIRIRIILRTQSNLSNRDYLSGSSGKRPKRTESILSVM